MSEKVRPNSKQGTQTRSEEEDRGTGAPLW
jgi:hypothetical protein